MSKQHPITPPPELVREWEEKYEGHMPEWVLRHVAAEAAQWGADQELDACCQWISDDAEALRIVRRPKPPSPAEEALEAQQRLWDGKSTHNDWLLIRRALERLQELENNQ